MTHIENKDILEELEIEKIKEEINKLRKSSWKSPERWTSVLTICATIILAYFTYQSGIFDKQKNTLDNKKSLLELENFKLEFDKKVLNQEISDFEITKIQIQDSIKLLKDSLNNLKSEIKDKELLYSKIESESALMKNEMKNLNKTQFIRHLINYSPHDVEKVNAYENTLSILKGNHSGLLAMGAPNMESEYKNKIYTPEDLFKKINYVSLDKITKEIEVLTLNNELVISYIINQKYISYYSTPIFVMISQNKQLLYLGLYNTRQIPDDIVVKGDFECMREKFKIDISKYKNGTYLLRFGFFHQGSLFTQHFKTPLFFQKEDVIKITKH